MSKNKIRMRVNKDESSVCKVCNASHNNSLELFDISFTDKHIITICDKCNDVLFSKSLKASCMVNSKVKDKHDMKIITMRRRRDKELNS